MLRAALFVATIILGPLTVLIRISLNYFKIDWVGRNSADRRHDVTGSRVGDTRISMGDPLQLVTNAGTPLTVTLLDPCDGPKPDPKIGVFAGPEVRDSLEIIRVSTLKWPELEVSVKAVTATCAGPACSMDGTCTTIASGLHD